MKCPEKMVVLSLRDIYAGDNGLEKQLKSEAKEYLKTTYLKPLRDASSDLTPKAKLEIITDT